MKRASCTVAVLFLCLHLLLTTAMAYDAPLERIDYEDGSYAIITTTEKNLTRANLADYKVYTYYNSDNQRCFAYTLYATFSYDGVTSAAETVDFDIVIYRREWDVTTHREWLSGNAAYGRASFSGPDGVTRPVYLSLTCDKNGNVS